MVRVAWDYGVGPPYLIWPKHHICQFSNWLTVAIHPQTRPADCIHCNILYCCRSWCNCSVNVNKASINVKVRVCQCYCYGISNVVCLLVSRYDPGKCCSVLVRCYLCIDTVLSQIKIGYHRCILVCLGHPIQNKKFHIMIDWSQAVVGTWIEDVHLVERCVLACANKDSGIVSSLSKLKPVYAIVYPL